LTHPQSEHMNTGITMLTILERQLKRDVMGTVIDDKEVNEDLAIMAPMPRRSFKHGYDYWRHWIQLSIY
jgi:hypothetical protein